MNGPKNTVVYMTREIERALGMAPSTDYRIVTNRTPYGEKVKRQYPDFVTLIESSEEGPSSTSGLISRGAPGNGHLLVFKNTTLIESAAKEKDWQLLNPPAALADKIEGKASQLEWLGELAKYLPSHELKLAKDISWEGTPFILQWAHGHTGGGTIFIDSEAKLVPLKERFPERLGRQTAYIDGPSFTMNVVATPSKILPGNVSYQITGLVPFTDNRFSTVGNDWGVAQTMLTATDRAWIKELVEGVGKRMQEAGWHGLFGIDMIKSEKTGEMYLIEINARQPASTTFESQLQSARRVAGAVGMTIFEAHLAALLGQPVTNPIIEITDGAQIVQRVTSKIKGLPEDVIGALELAGHNIISYPNTEPNADLIRIQSTKSIMAGHGVLNNKGKEIVDTISI